MGQADWRVCSIGPGPDLFTTNAGDTHDDRSAKNHRRRRANRPWARAHRRHTDTRQARRAIAEALWEGNDPVLLDALKNQCALTHSHIPQVRREALFFQCCYNLLLADKDELGLARLDSLRSHDWDTLWSEVSTMDA